MDWGALETPLDEQPLFPVQEPDGKRAWSEDDRCAVLLGYMRIMAPGVTLRHFANEGKRNPLRAKRLGIIAGLFDYGFWWPGGAALIEMKGYTKAGRPGALSPAQISFGNALHRGGHNVAMFFSPQNAADWLRACGAPVLREVTL